MYAAEHGRTAIVRYLVEKTKVQVNAQNHVSHANIEFTVCASLYFCINKVFNCGIQS